MAFNINPFTDDGFNKGILSTDISAGAAAGLGGLSLFAAYQGSQFTEQEAKVEAQKAQVSGSIAGFEQQINVIKQQQAGVNTKRLQLQTFRDFQRARSLGLAAAVNQGAQFSSGYQGAVGGQSATAERNVEFSSQNFQFGNQVLAQDKMISEAKQQIALLEGQEATLKGKAAADQGIISGAGGVLSSILTIGKLFAL